MIFRSIRKRAAMRSFPTPSLRLMAGALALLTLGGAGAPADYPADPADEAAQVAAHAVAYLYCTCVFVEKSDAKRCDRDLPAGMAQVERKVDPAAGRVTAVAASRIAVAKYAGASRGCVFQAEPKPPAP